MTYMAEQLKKAIEILELEIKRDKEALKTKSYKESPRYEPGDGALLRLRLKNTIQEKKRLENLI